MGETLRSLGIYWPKLIAQMVNFGIVLFILWKFAYRPVLKLLEERRQKVAEAMINAQKAREELARTEAQRQQVLAETNAQANKLIEEARAEAAKVRDEETRKAMAKAAELVAKGAAERKQLRERAMEDAKGDLARLVVNATRKVTGKVLTPEDERRLNEEATRVLAE